MLVYVKVGQMQRHFAISVAALLLLVSTTFVVSCSSRSPDDSETTVADDADETVNQQSGDAGSTADGGQLDADHALAKLEPRPEPIPPQHLVIAYRDGKARDFDARRAEKEGLTIVNLRNAWAPRVLRGTAELPSTYEEIYVGLANETTEPDDWAEARAADHYLEVYGISPSFSEIHKRLQRERSRKCFQEYDREALRRFDGFIAYRPHSRDKLRKRATNFRTFERRIKRAMEEQGVEDYTELEGEESLVRHWKRLSKRGLALRAAQQRLACEKLFPGRGHHISDAFDWATHIALLNFERRHRFYGWGYLNEETAHALAWSPEETAYQTMKRALTERVIDAAGIIEDGSTWDDGEPPTYTGADGEEHPVRNLTKEFSEAALHHLGFTDAEAAIAFLDEHDFENLRVALPLPELPEYYADQMDLMAVIDRGDVWYDFPYDEHDNETAQPRSRRPTTTLYAQYKSQKIPLVTYGTTIGGWRSTVKNGVEYWAYKNSDIGDRVWRKIIGAPSWIPPDSTPVRDLVTKRRRDRGRRWSVNTSEHGPSYASAYGLVMGVHELPVERDGETVWMDNGIRSHGSVSYQSIQKRHSHGCHRLHNHLALRLFGFVLAHRNHKRLGQEEVNYRRHIEYEGQSLNIRIDTRGYRFDLEPPVPVTVTRGRVLGKAQNPITEYIMKASERERLRREAEEAKQADAGVAAGGDSAAATEASSAPTKAEPVEE